MGLDVTAYQGLTKLDVVFNSAGEPVDPSTRQPIEDYMMARINGDFPGRADDIEDRAVYSVKDSFGFRAGSYGGYNHWRDQLAKLAGYAAGNVETYGGPRETYCAECWEGKTGPFSELINFSDAEGVIGTAVAAKLARDFADFQKSADEVDDDYFRDKYAEWRKAFEMAADNGAVDFH